MDWEKSESMWVPWILLPFMLLLKIQPEILDYVSLNLTLLYIPIAIMLTYKYRRHGFAVALIGAAPLLVSINIDDIFIGGQPELYVIVVHASWLTLSNRWFNFEKNALTHVIPMTLLFAISSIGFSYSQEPIEFNWWGINVLYYTFFILGLRNVLIKRWIVISGLLTIFNVVLMLAIIYGPQVADNDNVPFFELPNSFSLQWTWEQPGVFLTLLLFFYTGKSIRALASDSTTSLTTLKTGVKLAFGTSIFYLTAPMWTGLVSAVGTSLTLEKVLFAVSPAGSYFILPLLTLFLTIYRRNGMLLSVTLVVIYYVLSGIYDLNNDNYFHIGLGDFAVVIAFSMLGKQVVRVLPAVEQARTISWLSSPPKEKQVIIDLEEWKRQHDEISNTVRRVMLTLLAYALFCGLTLASSNDDSVLVLSSEIELPIAGTTINYSTFLAVGPLILLGLIIYLHLFLQSAMDLGRPEGARPLPYIFNMDNPLAAVLSGFLHYWLPVLLLLQFAWRATPQPIAGFWLGLSFACMGIFMVYLHITRMSSEKTNATSWLTNTMFFIFGLLFAMQMASGGALLKRPLLLDKAIFKDINLDGFDFREASLKGANFTGTQLNEAKLQGADLTKAIFTDVNLTGADLRKAILIRADFGKVMIGENIKKTKLNEANLQGANLLGAIFIGADLDKADLRYVENFGCEQLEVAQNWQSAYRSKAFACGASIPKPPEAKNKRSKF
jgi:hypothetical protein